jgi:hypothetical protein
MNWQEKAACIGAPTDIFFPEIPSGDIRRIHWAKAKEYCDQCSVTKECLAFVLPFEAQVNRRDGYWANMTPKERDEHARVDQPIRWRAK